MKLENTYQITINKNRGWRGLAEIKCYDKDDNLLGDTIFSYSEDMWQDLMKGYVVLQDKYNYYIFEINNTDALPQHSQRSVTLTDFKAKALSLSVVEKAKYITACEPSIYPRVVHFRKNTNAHTTSDFNYVGIRVSPDII
jgi:hypothetical protein